MASCSAYHVIHGRYTSICQQNMQQLRALNLWGTAMAVTEGCPLPRTDASLRQSMLSTLTRLTCIHVTPHLGENRLRIKWTHEGAWFHISKII
jgi:hypothetical protein